MLRVLKNSSFYFFNSLMPLFFSLISFPIITRYLSTSDYGLIGIISTYASVIGIFTTFQLGASLPRLKHDYGMDQLASLFSTIIFSIIVLTSLCFIFIFIFRYEIVNLLNLEHYNQVSTLLCISVGTMLINQLCSACNFFLMAFEEGFKILLRSVVVLPINLALTITLIAFYGMGVKGALLATLISTIITAVINLFYLSKFIKLDFKYRLLKEAFSYSLPIIPHALGGFLFMTSDVIILEKYVPTALIGLYILSNKFARIFEHLLMAVNNALLPNYYKLSKLNSIDCAFTFKNIYKLFLFFKLYVGLSFIFLFEIILNILVTSEFHGCKEFFYILIFAYIFRGLYFFCAYPLFFQKKTGIICIATLISGITNLFLNILYVPTYGVIFAAYSTLISNILVAAITFTFTKILKYPINISFFPIFLFIGINYLIAFIFMNADFAFIYKSLLFFVFISFVFISSYYLNLWDIRRLFNQFVINKLIC